MAVRASASFLRFSRSTVPSGSASRHDHSRTQPAPGLAGVLPRLSLSDRDLLMRTLEDRGSRRGPNPGGGNRPRSSRGTRGFLRSLTHADGAVAIQSSKGFMLFALRYSAVFALS